MSETNTYYLYHNSLPTPKPLRMKRMTPYSFLLRQASCGLWSQSGHGSAPDFGDVRAPAIATSGRTGGVRSRSFGGPQVVEGLEGHQPRDFAQKAEVC